MLVIDNSPENKGFIDKLSKRYDVDWVIISAYNFKINRIIEKNYKPITNDSVKL